MRTAVIDPATSRVVNTILAAEGFVLDGFRLVASETASIDDLHDPKKNTFGPPPVPLDERKAALKSAIDARAGAGMRAGYPHDFGGAYGVQVLQNRDTKDQTNWLSVASVANTLIAQGQANAPLGSLRTEANVNVPVTAAQAASVLTAMQAYLGGFIARAWALKDAVATADETELTAIDINAGWPA
ncbi:hypothetical protein [Methylobacterium nigriterrae]|uniref:DUF4376 domain-containing protein n=1 Tax=Methylobacterium nigriterrae TaxID=3127512 RepID=UPI003013F861